MAEEHKPPAILCSLWEDYDRLSLGFECTKMYCAVCDEPVAVTTHLYEQAKLRHPDIIVICEPCGAPQMMDAPDEQIERLKENFRKQVPELAYMLEGISNDQIRAFFATRGRPVQ